MSKTIPPTCPQPQSGPQYWRSLDELSDTPEFRRWVEREFPAGASEFNDPVSRRHFLTIMSASFLLGTTTDRIGPFRRAVARVVPPMHVQSTRSGPAAVPPEDQVGPYSRLISSRVREVPRPRD